ncbi:MAG TPA: hypothetical protein DDW78_06685 [Treponema sp.]|nr:hypothetical protein [Treponema sp.]
MVGLLFFFSATRNTQHVVLNKKSAERRHPPLYATTAESSVPSKNCYSPYNTCFFFLTFSFHNVEFYGAEKAAGGRIQGHD